MLPYRNPIATAKAIATIDQLSEGRLILGVGAGWIKEEFDALGADYENRYQRTREYINILESLWYSDFPKHGGKYHSFSDISFMPKTYNSRNIPVWMGGNSSKSIKMAVKKCSGWHAVGLNPDQLMECIKHIENQLVTTGNKREIFSISARKNLQITGDKKIIANSDESLRGNSGKIIEGLSGYKSAGVSHMIIYILSSTVNKFLDTLKIVADDIRPYLD